MTKWMLHNKNLEKQINMVLGVGLLFVIFTFLFSYFSYLWIAILMKWISLFCAAYFLIYACILTKKWVDKKYR